MLIALDLEASLIDNALSAKPRPGLYEFIEFCLEAFERVALFTTVEEPDAREVLCTLADVGAVPDRFTAVDYIDWNGEYKDLRFASNTSLENILFVDDDESWVYPDQVKQWIAIKPWHGETDDNELARVKQVLLNRLSG